MLRFLKRHRETLLVTLLGLVIFSLLNLMMVGVDPERFTNVRLGPYTAFRKLVVSGFDPFFYFMVSMLQPRYEPYRHPLLYFFIWPLSELNKWVKDTYDINIAIYIIGVLWTIISTACWALLYKIIRKVIGLSWISSLLYTLLFFSFSHVMLVTFIPDHMVLTMFVLLLTVYLITTSTNGMPIWKTLILYIFGTGVTTTNCVKIWMMDMYGKYSCTLTCKENLFRMFKRSLWYLIPTTLIFSCYVWEQQNTMADYQKGMTRMISIKLRTDSTFAKNHNKSLLHDNKRLKDRKDKQLGSSEFFAWTDNSIDRLPLLYENIFGEGLLLHSTYVLEDANASSKTRPVLVEYTEWYYYVINGIVVALCVCGLWVGRHEKVMWLVFMPFLFDMFLHVGMRFASADAYIMTAHWAFMIPISIAMLQKGIADRKILVNSLNFVVFLITAFLWVHNVILIEGYLSQL